MNTSLRNWATPMVIAAFTISAVTGVLMFFHKADGLVKPVHEWLSWLLVAGATIHTIANKKQFLAYLKRKSGVSIIAAGAIVTLMAIVVPMKGGSGNPVMKIAKGLSSAPLETVASAAQKTPEQAVQMLETRGIKVSDKHDNITSIAAANNKKDIEVLAMLFE
ncbi:MAG: DUF4405 domain-containing protein [Chlorobiaceae bacterium]|nr:DUF4405 domain-containing protein [Chlorobiaceae bacterium]